MKFLRRLFPARRCATRYHHRSAGPVVIDPDAKGKVHVWGRK